MLRISKGKSSQFPLLGIPRTICPFYSSGNLCVKFQSDQLAVKARKHYKQAYFNIYNKVRNKHLINK